MCTASEVMADDARTVFDLARRDHRRHVELIERVQGETGAARRARGVAELAADLQRHVEAEHAGLIGPLLSEASPRPLARRAVADHQRLGRLVADLTCRVYDEPGLRIALATYRAAFLEYARFEEEELFPAATLALGKERCERLAERYAAAERRRGDHMLAR